MFESGIPSLEGVSGNLTIVLFVGGVWAVTVLSPGPNLLATLHATARGGARAGVATAAGIGLGTTLWSGGSLIGLAALFETFAWAYAVVKFAGALYLIVIGLRLMLQRRRSAAGRSQPKAEIVGLRRAFLFGMATDLANPKAAAFFASLFAVAVPVDASHLFQAGLCALVVAIAAGWYALAAVLFARPRVAAAYGRARLWIERVAGALFVTAGLRLAIGRN